MKVPAWAGRAGTAPLPALPGRNGQRPRRAGHRFTQSAWHQLYLRDSWNM